MRYSQILDAVKRSTSVFLIENTTPFFTNNQILFTSDFPVTPDTTLSKHQITDTSTHTPMGTISD